MPSMSPRYRTLISLICFCIGVASLQLSASLPSLAWAALIIPFSLLAYACKKTHPYSSALFIGLVCGVMGFSWANLHAQRALDDRLPFSLEQQTLSVTGIIADLPKITTDSVQIRLRVEQAPQGMPSQLLLTYYRPRNSPDSPLPSFKAAQRWQLTVKLKRPHGIYNTGGFDSELWMMEQGLGASGSIREATQLTSWGWDLSLLHRLRGHIRERLYALAPNTPSSAILVALVIGDQSRISLQQWQTLTQTGVMHLMSISGLHITMVAGFVAAIASWLWRRTPWCLSIPARHIAIITGIASALAYSLLAGFSVPTQRTFYMLSVIAIGLWQSQRPPMTLLLAWGLTITLIIDPWAILSPGVWLSYSAVGLMVLAASGSKGKTPKWYNLLRSQWAVTLGGAPLLLFWFAQTSNASPLGNLVAVPLVSLIVTPLTLLAAITPIDSISQAFLHVSAWLLDHLALYLQWLATQPYAVRNQASPPLWMLLSMGAGIILCLLPRIAVLRIIGLLWCLPALSYSPPKLEAGSARLHIFDVGQGSAVLIQTQQHTLLYDTGPVGKEGKDSGNQIIIPQLRRLGISQLDTLMISHSDDDHSGGASSVLAAYPQTPLLGSLPAEHPLWGQSPQAGLCQAGQAWIWDDIGFEVLAPTAEDALQPSRKDNDLSCVLRINGQGKWQVLLTGDIEKSAEALLVQRYADRLSSDVLLAPHHGSKTSSTDAFVQAVQPQWVIYTQGYRNRFNHPHPTVAQRYEQAGAQALRSDAAGGITLDFNAQGTPHITTARGKNPRYWQTGIE